MSHFFTKLFIDSFLKGVGKTSGALITMFVSWQLAKITSGHDDLLSFMLGQKPSKKITDKLNEKVIEPDHEPDHEEINLEDVEDVKKYKSLFDKL